MQGNILHCVISGSKGWERKDAHSFDTMALYTQQTRAVEEARLIKGSKTLDGGAGEKGSAAASRREEMVRSRPLGPHNLSIDGSSARRPHLCYKTNGRDPVHTTAQSVAGLKLKVPNNHLKANLTEGRVPFFFADGPQAQDSCPELPHRCATRVGSPAHLLR